MMKQITEETILKNLEKARNNVVEGKPVMYLIYDGGEIKYSAINCPKNSIEKIFLSILVTAPVLYMKLYRIELPKILKLIEEIWAKSIKALIKSLRLR